MRKYFILLLLAVSCWSYAQYPYEKFPAPEYEEYRNWELYDWTETKQTVNHTLAIDQFFENGDTLIIQLTSFTSNWDNPSMIRIFRNKEQIQKLAEQMFFSTLNTGFEPIYIADINGDGLKDIKIITPSMGCGIAGLNVKVIYLFQTEDSKFNKVSFTDKMIGNRAERDFDSDGKYEIITMSLNGHENHNYWTFNIFEYNGDQLINANYKDNYPIMVQFLYRENFQITDKINRAKMKEFEQELPEDYDKRD